MTPDPEQVDENAGVFMIIPQDELSALLSHPLTSTLYLREWNVPFFREHSGRECARMIYDLRSVDPELVADTDWLAMRMSGGHGPPPREQTSVQSRADGRVIDVHKATPNRPVPKEYLIQKLSVLPGAMSSTKGKKTKVQNFVDALDQTSIKLFNHIDTHVFQKLLVDYGKLTAVTADHGGKDVFGDWRLGFVGRRFRASPGAA